jgi:hypothetical protein
MQMDTASFGKIHLADRILNHDIVNFTGRLIGSRLRNRYILYDPGFQEPKSDISNGKKNDDFS